LPRLGWVVIVLALVEAGWLAFDGTRALVVGDFLTPTSGTHAGQLGPWSKVVAAEHAPPSAVPVAAHCAGTSNVKSVTVAWPSRSVNRTARAAVTSPV